MRKTVVLVVNLMVTCAMTGFVGAVVPTTMTVQGRLADTSNNPVPAGSKDFTFKTYDEEVGGNEIWPHAAGEDQTLVTDDDGLWTAVLGTILPLSDLVFKNTSTWLEVTVDDGINPPETLPRVQLNTSPYTFRSVVSDQAEVANSLSSNTYLPRSGGEMTGSITNTGDPAIIMGKENFGSNNSISAAMIMRQPVTTPLLPVGTPKQTMMVLSSGATPRTRISHRPPPTSFSSVQPVVSALDQIIRDRKRLLKSLTVLLPHTRK